MPSRYVREIPNSQGNSEIEMHLQRQVIGSQENTRHTMALMPSHPLIRHNQQPKRVIKFPAHLPATALPFVTLLHSCSSMQELHQIHAQMLKTNAIDDPLYLAKFLSLCALSNFGDLDYAFKVFTLMPHRNSIHWNTLIHGYSLSSSPEHSLILFVNLLEEDPSLINPHTFPSVLKACSEMSLVFEGAQLHCCAIKSGTVAAHYVANSLIQMYFKCGRPQNGCLLFDRMPEKNIVSWNCVIGGFTDMGFYEKAKSLFLEMVHESRIVPNSVTLVRVVTACTKSGDFDMGKQVHQYIMEKGILLCLTLENALMNMYAKSGEMTKAHSLFDGMSAPDVVSWTTLVSGYARIGDIGMAQELFDKMPVRNTVAWNALLSANVLNSCYEEAITLFKDMLALGVKIDAATIISTLSACSRSWNLLTGKVIHGYLYKVSIDMRQELRHSLLGLYAKCGDLDAAEQLFHKMDVKNEISWTLMVEGYVRSGLKKAALETFYTMPHKDVASWNSLITALVQCNFFQEALVVFEEMQRIKLSPNCLTLVSTLSACAKAGALDLGKWLHAYIKRNGIEMDLPLCCALIDMYAKCGCIELSLEVFRNMARKDVIVWSTIIGGLAMHGHSNLALDFFKRMTRQGVAPDAITFIGVLSACAHSGLIDEGKYYFNLMTQGYGISPTSEHCGCMVDLFARHGLLREAKDFIDGISISSKGTAIWGALLGACSIYGNVELAEYAASRLLEVDPSNSGAYVLLSNVYAKASRWSDVRKVRSMMKEQGIDKEPGCSSIEVNGDLQEFFVGDASHPQSNEIYIVLMGLEKLLETTRLAV